LQCNDLESLSQPIGTFLDAYNPSWREVPTLTQVSKLADAFDAFAHDSISTLFVLDSKKSVIGKFSLADLFSIISNFNAGVEA
jgi:predicted transcriptional regulator